MNIANTHTVDNGSLSQTRMTEDSLTAFVKKEQLAQRREKIRYRLLATAFGIFVILVWAIATEGGFVHKLIISSPWDTAVATQRVMSANFFWPNVSITLQEIFWGFLIGMGAGAFFGIGVAMSATVRATIYPYLVALQAPPKIVLAPVFVTWFGFGMESKIA